MIIVLEGFDQAGKSTQSKLLSDFLATRQKKSKIFSFPDYSTPVGKEIKNFLSGRHRYAPQVIHCLLAANRWERSKEIKEALLKKYILIMNRYYQSNLVYGTVNGLDLKWLENLDKGLPKADLVILLDVKISDSFSRKKQNRDRFEKDRRYAIKITSSYRKLSKKYGWRIVDASREKELVHQDVKKIVLRYME